MANIFMDSSHNSFSWEKLGDIADGRRELGASVPVMIYRLLEYSVNHVLVQELGQDKADDIFRKAGFLAGTEFAKNAVDLSESMDGFIARLQHVMKDLQMGILRVEKMEEDGTLVLTIAEDLDCSGLPPTNELVCNFDEGFLSGILETYWKKPYIVREIDCWATGDRVCRFQCKVRTADSGL